MGTRSMDTRSCCVKLTNVSVLYRGSGPRLVGIRPVYREGRDCLAWPPECERDGPGLRFWTGGGDEYLHHCAQRRTGGPGTALAMESPGQDLFDRGPRLHVRCLGCDPERHPDSVVVKALVPLRRGSGMG